MPLPGRMWGVFAAGVAVGAVLMRLWSPPVSEPVRAEAAIGAPAPASTLPAASAPDQTPPLVASASATAPAVVAGSGAAAVPPATAPTPDAAAAGFEAAVDSGNVVPIDVGENLRKHWDGLPSGHQNQIAEAHRALEREPRDDSWAYTMESELQNSLLGEASTSGLKVDGIDCRSTLCEVRLSGNSAEQAAAVKRWNESLIGQPAFGQRLFLNYSSTYSDNGRTDGIFIFRKPAPAPAPAPKP